MRPISVAGKVLHHFADLNHAQGFYEAAEPLYQRSLAIREKAALDPDHSNVAQSNVAQVLNDLAELYLDQGRYEAAEPLLERALAIREKMHVPDHPDLVTSMENYATLLRKTGRDGEAVELEARVKTSRSKNGE